MVAPLLGRSLEGVLDRYFLADDRRGVLVVVRSHPSVHLPWTLVTYLRFGPAQRAFAVRIWGER
ncbi:hypothetical protein L6R50_14160 [Myxococcota bacterium]|nr:hypothetical protein [Myxococcota bacterium]